MQELTWLSATIASMSQYDDSIVILASLASRFQPIYRVVVWVQPVLVLL